LTDLHGVTHLKATNIPVSENEVIPVKNKDDRYWMIMNVAPGVSLQKLHTKCPFPLLDCVLFNISLLTIIKSFHAKGIIHRDLKPENIHIDMHISGSNKLLADAQITILDFGLAYIQNQQVRLDADFEEDPGDKQNVVHETLTKLGTEYGNSWYRVPQLRSFKKKTHPQTEIDRIVNSRRSPTIDASGVCAILFWLSTGIEPRDREKPEAEKEKPGLWYPPYHYLYRDQIVEAAKTAVEAANSGEDSFSPHASKN
jgi:serine/threonine protein kinase